MNNHPEASQTQQKAIWYYSVNGSKNGPLTTTGLMQMYKTGDIKKDTLVWKHGLPSWKPLSQLIQNSVAVTNPADVGQSLKHSISIIVITVMLIAGCIFAYFQFFAKTPLDGGWQGKNILGITSGIVLFDGDNYWYCDANDKPHSANFRATKVGDNSYKVTLSGNNQSKDLLVSFIDNNTINVSMHNSTQVETLTRIDKTMAKNMMGIE